jgi:hypothetical protein
MEWINRYVGLITLILFFTNCVEKKDTPLIPSDTMSKVLGDAHMAEGALLNVAYAKKDSMRAVYYKQIYEIYNISEESFRHDMEYYQKHPEVMEDLYEQVIKHLGEMESEMKK